MICGASSHGSITWCVCTLATTYDGGDHIIIVEAVVEALAEEGELLLYYKGTYR
jgi:flavin reductase (DIM6/NTAB) family NADH-FMN oxidoreductase RutF